MTSKMDNLDGSLFRCRSFWSLAHSIYKLKGDRPPGKLKAFCCFVAEAIRDRDPALNQKLRNEANHDSSLDHLGFHIGTPYAFAEALVAAVTDICNTSGPEAVKDRRGAWQEGLHDVEEGFGLPGEDQRTLRERLRLLSDPAFRALPRHKRIYELCRRFELPRADARLFIENSKSDDFPLLVLSYLWLHDHYPVRKPREPRLESRRLKKSWGRYLECIATQFPLRKALERRLSRRLNEIPPNDQSRIQRESILKAIWNIAGFFGYGARKVSKRKRTWHGTWSSLVRHYQRQEVLRCLGREERLYADELDKIPSRQENAVNDLIQEEEKAALDSRLDLAGLTRTERRVVEEGVQALRRGYTLSSKQGRSLKQFWSKRKYQAKIKAFRRAITKLRS